MAKVRIVAAILDTEYLTLYKENGDTIQIAQGDARIKPILDAATVPLSRGEIVEVSLEQNNDYHEFEKQTSGLVRFFRVAKNFVKHIFNPETDAPHEEPVRLGAVPGSLPPETRSFNARKQMDRNPAGPTASKISDATPNQKPTIQQATAQIIAAATPVSSPEFQHVGEDSADTIIATVGDKIIPGMENLKTQFAHASKMGNTQGVTNFLKRIAAVIDKRAHSIDDLLRFMERGDLPIADDGSIIAYKILKTGSGGNGETFVDCHTGKVPQRVGSFVMMDPSLVDPNRNNECSNGLHIARRKYLRGFGGDIMVIAKIAPEDVIAVPSYDSNKVRVCGYHILGLIPKSEHDNLRNDRPMTSCPEAQRLLTAALRGQHIDRIEEVRITGQKGEGVRITPLSSKSKPRPIKETAKDAVALDDVKAAPAVDAKELSQTSTEIKNAPAPVATPVAQAAQPKKEAPVSDRAAEIKTQLTILRGKGSVANKTKAAQTLQAIKQKARKPYGSMGINVADQELISSFLEKPAVKPATKSAPKSEPKVEAQPKAEKKTPSKTSTKKTPAKVIAKAPVETRSTESRGDKARRLFEENKWNELQALKKSSKVNWSKLGFSIAEEGIIFQHGPKK